MLLPIKFFVTKLYSIFFAFIVAIFPSRLIGFLVQRSKIVKKNSYGIYYNISSGFSWDRFNRAYVAEPLFFKFMNSMSAKSVFWDIGACLGTFSTYAIKNKIVTIAFEANPYNVKDLHENMLLNIPKNWDGSLSSVIPICLSSENKMISLAKRAQVIGNAIEIKDSKKNEFNILIPSLNLNFSQLKKLPQPSHIKVDVDGNEFLVLEALKTILKSKNMIYIYIEISHSFETINKFIEGKGYILDCVNGENFIYKKIKNKI